MRVGFVRNVGLAALGLAVAALAACNDDPLSFDNDQTTGMFVNPSVMVVPAGRVSKLESRALNQGNEPTFAAVEATVSPACATVAPDPDATIVSPPGLFEVTGGNALGGCTITLTSGGVTREVDVTVVTDAIEFVNPPATLSFGSTVQLEARLVSFDGTTVTPFAATDATWTSDDEAVATVDETGLVTGTGAGVATIEVCWSGTEATGTAGLATRCAETAIEVVVLPPTIDSVNPATGLVGEVVTVGLTGLVDVHSLFIDGIALDPIYIESFDATAGEIVFWWPFNGIGTHEVTVGSAGAASDPVSFELTSEGSADDPAYLDPGTAPLTALPLKKVAYLSPDVLDHFYLIDLAAPATIVIDLDWDSGSDLDILVTDGAFAGFECTDGATGAQPEQSICALPAGQHLIWINDYDETTATYVLEAAVQ